MNSQNVASSINAIVLPMAEQTIKWENRDRVDVLLGNMTKAAEAGTLTEDQISAAMRIIFDDGDYIDRAIGTMWITDHPVLFGKVVSDVDAFLRAHFHVYQMVPVVLICSGILGLIPEEKRVNFVFDAYLAHGARNDGWINAALKVGVSRMDIAEIILAKLEMMNVTSGNMDFLEYGSGMVYHDRLDDRDTPWSMLSDEQLNQAAQICARKAPSSVLMYLGKLGLRLSKEKVAALRVLAVQHLPSVCGLSLSTVQKWPSDLQQIVFDRLVVELTTPCEESRGRENVVHLVIYWLLQKDHVEAQKLFGQIKPSLDRMDACMVYRNARPQLKALLPEGQNETHEVAKWLGNQLWDRLWAAGYILGQVVVGRNPRGEVQYQVVHNGFTYVHDRFAHRYWPSEGDLVIFSSERASFLTSTVRLTTFVPVVLGKDG